MVDPLIVIGSKGSMWSHTRVLERIGDAMRLCGSTCASGVAPSMGRNFTPQMLEKVCRSGPEPPRVRRRPKLEGGRAREAVCVGPPAPRAVANEMLQMPRSARTAATILVAWTRSLAIS
jgi:hypothetical protein